MTDRPRLIPGPNHPISIEPAGKRVVVKVADRIIADTRNALILREARYPPVFYIPRADADMALLQCSTHHSYCPYKGEASYFGIIVGGERSIDAVWSYEAPYEAVAQIADHLAFYPDRVDSIETHER